MSDSAEKNTPPVVLFGYASSPFTNKVRLVLRLKGIEYTYIPVPSMLPRPLLTTTFALPYRKIPVLAIGPHIYCDTSLIIRALEHHFPASTTYHSIYPPTNTTPPFTYAPLADALTSYWFDKPLFRTTTGLIPGRVWNTEFGKDRANLIGHRLDPEKLDKKIPENLSALDMHLSMIEALFKQNEYSNKESTWIFPTQRPGLADVGLWYQIKWGWDIGAGKGIYNLSGGGTDGEGMQDIVARVFNEERYPGVWAWYHRFEAFIGGLPVVEREIDGEKDGSWKEGLKAWGLGEEGEWLLPTAAKGHELDGERGLRKGVVVKVAPDDTGRDSATVGKLVALGPEEVVLRTEERGEVECLIHFPRLGFVVRVIDGEGSRL